MPQRRGLLFYYFCRPKCAKTGKAMQSKKRRKVIKTREFVT